MTDSMFHTIILDAGCTLGTDGSQTTLTGDPAIFRREVTTRLRSHPQYPAPAIDKFLQELQDHLDDLANLRSCLLPVSVNGGSGLKVGSSIADSFVRILLSIDILQPTLIDNLLERLPGFIPDNETETIDSPIPRLILQQLRWLDHIVEPERLTEKIIEMIEITPVGIQHEIITSLPEIINDSEHKSIVTQLKDLMSQSHELVVPILDALANLNLNPDHLEDVRETVIDRLESANLEDLPVLVKFLLQSVTSDTVTNVIAHIRRKLDFRSIGKLQHDQAVFSLSQRAAMSTRRKKERMPEALLLDAIKCGIRFHKFVCDAWVKAITDVQRPQGHKVIDVLVLFILHSMTHMKKKVEAIFRKKIVAGTFTQNLLTEAVQCHSDGLREYFNVVLSLSESLLRSSQQQAVIARCASALYSSAFGVFDAYHRQEIVGSLVTHIGSGAPTEIGSALSVLLDLVRQDPAGMSRYAVFVKGILDYLDNLSMDQIRVLFEIFSVLAFESEVNGEGGSGNLLSDILIVIRKQLSNPTERYKQMGVIGGLAIVTKMGSRDSANVSGSSQHDADSEVTATQALRRPLLQQAINILEMIRHSCAKSYSCLSIAHDELAYLVSKRLLDRHLEVWINDHIADAFSDLFLFDKEEMNDMMEAQKEFLKGMPMQTWMNLDGVDSGVTVKVYPCLCAPVLSPDVIQQRDLILSLCSLFKLMQACEKAANNGSLDGIDALLGCGVCLYEKVEVSHMKSVYTTAMREAACNSLFFAVNWFRELLNAFSSQGDDEMAAKILLRLQNIGQLETILQELLECTSSFRPWGLFAASPLSDNKENVGGFRRPTSPKKAKGGGGNTARRSALNRRKVLAPRRPTSDDEEPAPGRNTSASNGAAPRFGCVADLRPYMRELELDILKILGYGEIQRQLVDTNLEPKDNSDTVKLMYPELKYLLEDLNRKLEHKLVPVATIPFFAKKKEFSDDKMNHTEFTLLSRMSASEFVEKINDYLPFLLEKLEGINNEIEIMASADDTDDEQSQMVYQCFRLLFQALDKLLSWPDLKSPDNQEILKKLFDKLAARIRLDVAPLQKHSLQSLAVEAFTYLSKFAERAPSASIAILLHRLLSKIIDLTPNPKELSCRSGVLAEKVLETEWNDMKSVKPDNVIYLLGQQISRSSKNPIELISDYVSTVLPAIERRDDDVLSNYPFLNKDTYVVYYKALSIELVSVLNQFQEKDYNHDAAIAHITEIVTCWQSLTTSVKGNDKRSLLSVVLKYGRLFVDRFTKSIMPYLGGHFKTHRDSVLSILKSFQYATRTLQIICGHAKITKDTSLALHVPQTKKAMETVIFQVKAMLTDNNCPPDAFYFGALKHRDIRGEEVSSQMSKTAASEDEDAEEADELGSDDQEAIVKKVANKRKSTSQSKNREDEPDRSDDEQRAKKKPKRSKPAPRKKPNEQATHIAADGRLLSNSQVDSSDMEQDEPETEEKDAMQGNEEKYVRNDSEGEEIEEEDELEDEDEDEEEEDEEDDDDETQVNP